MTVRSWRESIPNARFRPAAPRGGNHPQRGLREGVIDMKGILVLSGSGPLLLLSSYPAIDDPALIAKLRAKGLAKFLAWEVPVDQPARPLRLHLPRHRRAARDARRHARARLRRAPDLPQPVAARPRASTSSSRTSTCWRSAERPRRGGGAIRAGGGVSGPRGHPPLQVDAPARLVAAGEPAGGVERLRSRVVGEHPDLLDALAARPARASRRTSAVPTPRRRCAARTPMA